MSEKSKFKNFLPALIFLVVAMLMAVSTKLGDKINFYPNMVGKEAPVFQAYYLEGEGKFESSELNSNAIVNLWASWCSSCLMEHEVLLKLAETHKIYGVNSGDFTKPAKRYLKDHGNPFHKNIIDPQRHISLAFGAKGLPETYLIGKDGVIYYHHRGVLTQKMVDEELLPIITKLESME